MFFQRPAGCPGPPAQEMPTAGEGRGKLLYQRSSGLDAILTHRQGFSSSLKSRPPRQRTGGERELTHPAAALKRNSQDPPSPGKLHLPSQKARQPGKHHRKSPPARRVNDQDVGIPSCPTRSHPTGPEEQKSSREGWKRELGQPLWPLPVPNHPLARGERGQIRMCQRWRLPVRTPPQPKRHQFSRATALRWERLRDAAGTATASRSDRPRSPPQASPAAASREPLRREPSLRTGEAKASLCEPRLPAP